MTRWRLFLNNLAYAIWESHPSAGPRETWPFGPPNSRAIDKLAWWLHSVAMAPPRMSRAQMRDKIDGLESDLDSALDVLWRRGDDGARDWVRWNYPKRAAAFAKRSA